MKQEKSAGAIIFKKKKRGFSFLILLKENKRNSFWDFPKSSVEKNESDFDALTKCISNNTNLTKINTITNFHANLQYAFTRDNVEINKRVVLYLAESIEDEDVKLSGKHIKFFWGSYEEVSKMLNYEDQKRALKDGYEFLKKMKG